MKVMDLKYRLHRSLDIFGNSAFFAMAILILLFIVQKDFWLAIITPCILMFSVIGLHYVSKGLLMLSEKDGELTEMTQDEYIDKLYGIQGFKTIFLIAAAIIIFCGATILYAFNRSFFTFSEFSLISFIFFGLLIYSVYRVSQELSFVIMSVTIIDTMKMQQHPEEKR